MPIAAGLPVPSPTDEAQPDFVERWMLAERWRRDLGQSLVRAVA
jgi:hypothetical protein